MSTTATLRPVSERCLALLRRLMRGPARKDELLRIVEQYADHEHSAAPHSVDKRLEKDRDRLRELFGVELKYSRSKSSYTLLSLSVPLMDLTYEAVRGVAFLQATFADESTPMQPQVGALLQALAMTLPKERVREIDRERGLIELDLRKRDADTISDVVWEKVTQAVREHRELEFDYRSPQQDDEKPRRHRVEPQRMFFDTVRGHYYLEAFALEIRGPKGRWMKQEMASYRLGRLAEPSVLPKKFVPGIRSAKKYDLIYELPAKIARFGITKHFSDCTVDCRSDGSVVIHARSSDLFRDVRTLLHYGANCRILGGEEALREIKEIVGGLYRLYSREEN